MLNSKQLIEIAGISRATLNNYVALGILPSPVIKTPAGDAGRATRLGYFEENAVDQIKLVQELKKQGLSMAQIAARLGAATGPATAASKTTVSRATSSASQAHEQAYPAAVAPGHVTLDISIHRLPGPAYMVNNNFELIWWNDKACELIFDCAQDLPGDLESRNLLKVLFNSALAKDVRALKELLLPHIAAGKKRLSQQALIKIYSSMDAVQLSVLKEAYDEAESLGREPMAHFPVVLPVKPGAAVFDEPVFKKPVLQKPVLCDLYICFYREGILFTFNPVVPGNNFLLDFLSKRNYVINELLRQRKPYLTDVAVMVADVQNSTKICAELPAEEYFELINNIWQLSEAIFRKYYGTYGKHAGDGMVYYFFPQPDCDYNLNAIQCAVELKEMMKSITQHWQARKGWFSEIHLNIGLNAGQEWFGSYHAGGHVEFTVLGETINYASRISDFARNGSIWATKNMLNQISAAHRKQINFGITRKTHHEESVFVTNSYATIGTLLDGKILNNEKFRDIEMLPITEIRGAVGVA